MLENKYIANFSTNNPTAFWAVSVDGLFMYCSSLEQAIAIHDDLCGGTELDINDTPFHSAEIIHPYSIADNYQDPDIINDTITDFIPSTYDELIAYKHSLIA